LADIFFSRVVNSGLLDDIIGTKEKIIAISLRFRRIIGIAEELTRSEAITRHSPLDGSNGFTLTSGLDFDLMKR
jgi:hypothetical protein